MIGSRYKSPRAAGMGVDDLTGARVAITGASSGIGAACARAFAEQGASVAICARRHDALEAVAEGCRAAGAEAVRVDVVDVTSAGDVATWADELAAWGGLDVAIANAGVGHHGPFLERGIDEVEAVVETNVVGVLRTVHATGPLLDDGGQVQVIGSMGHVLPLPYMSVYAATKAALTSWTRSVRPELARRGIDLTLVLPGTVRTGFFDAIFEDRPTPGVVEAALAEGIDPEAVAEVCVDAARRRPDEVPMSWSGRLLGWLARLAPGWIGGAVERRLRPR